MDRDICIDAVRANLRPYVGKYGTTMKNLLIACQDFGFTVYRTSEIPENNGLVQRNNGSIEFYLHSSIGKDNKGKERFLMSVLLGYYFLFMVNNPSIVGYKANYFDYITLQNESEMEAVRNFAYACVLPQEGLMDYYLSLTGSLFSRDDSYYVVQCISREFQLPIPIAGQASREILKIT